MIFGISDEEAMGKSNLMCGECVRPIYDCPWMSKGKPVKGWTAEKSVVHAAGKSMKTYHIIRCPLFIKHPRSIYFDEEGNRV